MYKYFKSLAEKSSCSLSGVCSIHPATSALYNILLYEIRETVFYFVKMKEFGFLNHEAKNQCIVALSLFLINTSLNEKKYLDLIKELDITKKNLKEDYIKYCTENELPCEILKTNIEINEKTTILNLIEYSQNNYNNRLKVIDKSKQSLFELISLFAKLSAVIACKIKRFDNTYDEFDYEILRFFALTNAYSIRIEKIKRRIQEFCPVAFKLKEKLFSVLEKRYGAKQDAVIQTSNYKGHSILISGDDVIELEKVLKTIENMDINNDINVYTNGSLFLAHFYPYFQKNKFLKGHWGVNDARYDFSMFPGSILITRSFLQKIDNLYKGDIFSNKVISFSKVNDIKNDDYEPLIKSALLGSGFLKSSKKMPLTISYDKNKIYEIVEQTINLKPNEVVLIAGNLESKKILEEYKNKKIIHFSTPLESDILLNSIQKFIKNNIQITIFFPHCDIESLYNVFLLLNTDIKIYIAACSHIVINPHVIEALKENFHVQIID